MNKTRLVIGITLALCGGWYSVHAESIDLGEAVVRHEYAEVNRLQETKQVIVITKEDLKKKNYENLEQVLNDVPSINVGLTGWGQIDIRGQGAEQAERNIQILLDGAPITVLTSHPYNNNYNYIPVENIDKIEIVPSGGAVMYGAGAAGGVINITTNLKSLHKPTDRITTTISNYEKTGSIAYGELVNDKLSYQLNYTKSNKDLYFDDTYRNSQYASLGVAYLPNPTERIAFRTSKVKEESRFVMNLTMANFLAHGSKYKPKSSKKTIGLDKNGKKISVLYPEYLDGDRTLFMNSLNYSKNFTPDTRLSVDLFSVKGDFLNSQEGNEPMNHSSQGVKAKLDRRYDAQEGSSFLIGVDWVRSDAKLAYDDYKYDKQTKKYKVNPLHFFYNKEVKAAYITNTVNKGKVSFTQGLRREKARWDIDKKEARVEGVIERCSIDTAVELGASYRYNDTGRIYARYERAFNHPDGIQAVNSEKDLLEATKAKDEIFNLYELGWNDTFGNTTATITAFYSLTNNQIDRLMGIIPGKGLVRATENMLNTKRHGVDVGVTHRAGKWTLKGGYTYLKGRSEYTAEGRAHMEAWKKKLIAYSIESLRAVPKHKAVLQASYAPSEQWNVEVSYNYVSKYDNFLSTEDAHKVEENRIPGHSTVDISTTYRPTKDVAVQFGVSNIFDTQYAYYQGEVTNGYSTLIPGDARTYFATVRYQF